MKKIWSVCVAICFVLLAVCPLLALPVSKSFASARTIEEDSVILSRNIEDLPLDAQNAQIWNFTPLKRTDPNGLRFEGASLQFTAQNASFKFEQFENANEINGESEVALSMWLYVPSAKQSNFSVALNGNDGESEYSFTWFLETKDGQTNFLTTTEQSVKNSLVVPGWRHILLPFVASKATINGNIDAVNLTKVDTFKFSQSQEADVYPAIYSVQLVSSNGYTDIFADDAEGYDIVSHKAFFETYITDAILGDKINLPTFAGCLQYAWIGETKLGGEVSGTITQDFYYKNDLDEIVKITEDCPYVWKIKITKPDGNVLPLLNFGTNTDQKFDQTGTYKMQMVVEAQIGGNKRIVAQSGAVLINIESVENGVWFESSNINIDTTSTFSIKFRFDSHWRLDPNNPNIEIVSSNPQVLEVVSVEYDKVGGGVVVVRGNKPGKATLSVTGEFVRSVGNTGREKQAFESNVVVNVKKLSDGSNKTLLIVLSSILGAGVLAGVAMGIVAIVKHNKMGVR